MVDPNDPQELVEEALDEAEERQRERDTRELAVEKKFRNRVSVLVGLFAVALAIIHVAAAGNQRKSLLRNISASDDFSYMQAKIIRETVLKSVAAAKDVNPADRAAMLAEAHHLNSPDSAGHAIGQLRLAGEHARDEGQACADKGERYELGETALQIAIVLLSIALIARSWAIVVGAGALAGIGLIVAVLTALGLV